MKNEKSKKETDIVPVRFHQDENGSTFSGHLGKKNENLEGKIGYAYDVENGKLHLRAGFGPRDVATIEPEITHENGHWSGSLSLYMNEKFINRVKKYAIVLGGLVVADVAYQTINSLIEKYSVQLASEYKIGLPLAISILAGVFTGYKINRFFENKLKK